LHGISFYTYICNTNISATKGRIFKNVLYRL
jgi:hypothetical protein